MEYRYFCIISSYESGEIFSDRHRVTFQSSGQSPFILSGAGCSKTARPLGPIYKLVMGWEISSHVGKADVIHFIDPRLASFSLIYFLLIHSPLVISYPHTLNYDAYPDPKPCSS